MAVFRQQNQRERTEPIAEDVGGQRLPSLPPDAVDGGARDPTTQAPNLYCRLPRQTQPQVHLSGEARALFAAGRLVGHGPQRMPSRQ